MNALANQKMLWEILVPTQMFRPATTSTPDLMRPIRTRYHRVWDEKVREITGGLTIMRPAVGQWVSESKQLFIERMIPVRIACTRAQLDTIIKFTLEYYNQEAVFAYLVSEVVIIEHRK